MRLVLLYFVQRYMSADVIFVTVQCSSGTRPFSHPTPIYYCTKVFIEISIFGSSAKIFQSLPMRKPNPANNVIILHKPVRQSHPSTYRTQTPMLLKLVMKLPACKCLLYFFHNTLHFSAVTTHLHAFRPLSITCWIWSCCSRHVFAY